VIVSWFTSLNAGRYNGCNSKSIKIRLKIFDAVKIWFSKGKNGQMKKRLQKVSKR
jgi:hypothetical protein